MLRNAIKSDSLRPRTAGRCRARWRVASRHSQAEPVPQGPALEPQRRPKNDQAARMMTTAVPPPAKTGRPGSSREASSRHCCRATHGRHSRHAVPLFTQLGQVPEESVVGLHREAGACRAGQGDDVDATRRRRILFDHHDHSGTVGAGRKRVASDVEPLVGDVGLDRDGILLRTPWRVTCAVSREPQFAARLPPQGAAGAYPNL